MSWMFDLFHTEKPIIGLLHLPPLPGDPFYPRNGSILDVIDRAMKDLNALQYGGVDGILITNEFSLPYEKHVSPVTIASMAMVVGAIRSAIHVPFGVEAIYDADATIDVCAATGAQFTRCMFTGAWAGDLGIIDRDIAVTLRRKRALGLDELRLFYFVTSEGEVFLNDRSTLDIAQTIIFNCHPDCLVVGGAVAGQNPGADAVRAVRKIAGSTPVVCGTGCKLENVAQILEAGDGAFVGTTFKENGKFENPIDPQRVKAFMDHVREIRREEQQCGIIWELM